MDEFTDDIDKYVVDSNKFLQQCKNSAFEMRNIIAESDHTILLNAVKKTVSKVNKITSGIYDFYDVHIPKNQNTMKDKLNLLIDCNDTLLDKLTLDIEEAAGKNASSTAIDDITDRSSASVQKDINPLHSNRVILTPRRVDKPQESFTSPVDNSADTPFIPKLKEKPHSKKPLSIMLCVAENDREYYSHPYNYELVHFKTPDHQLERTVPIEPLNFEATPFVLIDSIKDLHIAVRELSACKAIAVDLEHHSKRSYQGLTCLLQISSRSKDYIVDTLLLRGHMEILNKVFANPKIIKVFHGASSDILWLQRDLGVYVVNMFDTHQAAILLEYPIKSLAHLLTKFCEVTANKIYQRADWRIRPLPADFIHYARQDTHYLLYIFDKMRNELIDEDNANLIDSAYSRSTSICLERYEKPFIDENSHMDLYLRSRVMFNSRQRYALKKLFQWRDEVARKKDESVEYVLASHMMLQICEHLPREVAGMLALCSPIPVHLKAYQLVVHHIIQEAKKLPLEEVENVLFYRKPEKPAHNFELKLDLISKFDFSHIESNPVGLSTILSDSFEPNAAYRYRQIEGDDTQLESNSYLFNDETTYAKRQPRPLIECSFITPFQRYSTMSGIQELLDESRRTSEPATDDERVREVLDFLSKIDPPEADTSLEEGEILETETSQVPTPEPVVETPEPPREKKTILKQVITENKWKVLREEELSNNFDEIGSKKKQRQRKVKKEDSTEFQPFDYSQANTSFLKPTKINNKEKIKQKYKAKRSQQLTGLKKSGLKSFSWGAS